MGVDGKHRQLGIGRLFALCLAAAAAPAAASCGVSLVMGLDVSSSVDDDELGAELTGEGVDPAWVGRRVWCFRVRRGF